MSALRCSGTAMRSERSFNSGSGMERSYDRMALKKFKIDVVFNTETVVYD